MHTNYKGIKDHYHKCHLEKQKKKKGKERESVKRIKPAL